MEKEKDALLPEEKSTKKKSQVSAVLILGIAIVVCALALTIVLAVAAVSAKEKQKADTTRYEITTNNKIETTTDEEYLNSILGVTQNSTATQSNEKETQSNVNDNLIQDTTKNAIIESYEQLAVNGENYLSDHYENEYIQLVEREYGVDTDLLVAIYSVPDSGTNFVLQFNGKTNSKDEIIKSPDTLEKVYQIDLDKNIKVATGTSQGNVGVSYPESVLCFNMVKKLVMEQYPNYFTGLEG